MLLLPQPLLLLLLLLLPLLPLLMMLRVRRLQLYWPRLICKPTR